MDDAEFRHSEGKLSVAPIPGPEDEAVSRAVHWLETPFLLLDVEGEHAVLVILPVTRLLPELAVEHVGRDN
jgi:hypothetical protein